jgi:hypothetical protein
MTPPVDNKLKEAVLEQARTLAKDFVTEFRAEVTKQLGAAPISENIASKEAISEPAEFPDATLPLRSFESYNWGRNTTNGLSALKLVPAKNVDKPHQQEALTPLTDTRPWLNDNFTEERVQKLIESVDSRIKNIAQTMEDGLEKEQLIQTLERTRDSLNNTLQHPLGRDAQDVLRLQASQEKIRARNEAIRTVYSSDLGEEIQAQAKALLPLVEALEQEREKHSHLKEAVSNVLHDLAQQTDKEKKESAGDKAYYAKKYEGDILGILGVKA